MIARRTTRSGEPVHFGNDPSCMPGAENTYQSYGTAWANLSNTPFRLYKHWIHEGGISTPFIVHWPNGIAARTAALRHAPGYLPDIMATIVDVTGVDVSRDLRRPRRRPARRAVAAARCSRTTATRSTTASRCSGSTRATPRCASGSGSWCKRYPRAWELYDMDADRTELHDLAAREPRARARRWRAQYDAWAERCGVIPREKIVALMQQPGRDARVLGEGRGLARRARHENRRARPGVRPLAR